MESATSGRSEMILNSGCPEMTLDWFDVASDTEFPTGNKFGMFPTNCPSASSMAAEATNGSCELTLSIAGRVFGRAATGGARWHLLVASADSIRVSLALWMLPRE